MNGKQKTAAAALAVALIMTSEGLLLHAKPDIATGQANICYGETHGVKFGQTATREECVALLKKQGEPTAEATVDSCIPPQPTAGVRAALIDFAYNEGGGRKGGKDGLCVLKSGKWSTIRRRAVAGNWRGVCYAFMEWTKAGHKQLPGLVARRTRERDMCLKGFTSPGNA